MIFPEYVTVKHENPDRPENGLWVWSTVRPNGFTTTSRQMFVNYALAVETAEAVARSQRMPFIHIRSKKDTLAWACNADARRYHDEGHEVDRIQWEWLRRSITVGDNYFLPFFAGTSTDEDPEEDDPYYADEAAESPAGMAEIQRRSMIARMCNADARQIQSEGDNVDRVGWQWLRDVITLENAANAQFFCVPQDIYVDVDGTQDWQIDGRW